MLKLLPPKSSNPQSRSFSRRAKRSTSTLQGSTRQAWQVHVLLVDNGGDSEGLASWNEGKALREDLGGEDIWERVAAMQEGELFLGLEGVPACKGERLVKESLNWIERVLRLGGKIGYYWTRIASITLREAASIEMKQAASAESDHRRASQRRQPTSQSVSIA